MAYLDEQDRIRKQALVTAQANGIVSKSNDVIETAEVFISQATPARDTTVRFGGPSDQEKSLTILENNIPDELKPNTMIYSFAKELNSDIKTTFIEYDLLEDNEKIFTEFSQNDKGKIIKSLVINSGIADPLKNTIKK